MTHDNYEVVHRPYDNYSWVTVIHKETGSYVAEFRINNERDLRKLPKRINKAIKRDIKKSKKNKQLQTEIQALLGPVFTGHVPRPNPTNNSN